MSHQLTKHHRQGTCRKILYRVSMWLLVAAATSPYGVHTSLCRGVKATPTNTPEGCFIPTLCTCVPLNPANRQESHDPKQSRKALVVDRVANPAALQALLETAELRTMSCLTPKLCPCVSQWVDQNQHSIRLNLQGNEMPEAHLCGQRLLCFFNIHAETMNPIYHSY